MQFDRGIPTCADMIDDGIISEIQTANQITYDDPEGDDPSDVPTTLLSTEELLTACDKLLCYFQQRENPQDLLNAASKLADVVNKDVI